MDGRSDRPPIFIVGTPRSGTTLLARVLNRSPNIFMPSETNYFPDIYAQRRQLGSLPGAQAAQRVRERLRTLYSRYNEPAADQHRVDEIFDDRDRAARLDESLKSYCRAFQVFMELQMESAGKSRWGNNTPKDLFHVPQINECFPDARFIVCFRDLRDFLRSYRDKRRATTSEELERITRLYHPVVTAALWKISMRRIAGMSKLVPACRMLRVRYEALVSRPEATVREICEFVGEPFAAGMLELSFSNSAEHYEAPGIHPGSVGLWRRRLSGAEVRVAQAVAGAEMRLFQYQHESVPADPREVAALLLSAPWALARALSANRARTGPVLPYLARRFEGFLRG